MSTALNAVHTVKALCESSRWYLQRAGPQRHVSDASA